MMYKILQGLGTASGTVLQKRCSRICGLNPGLIYLQKETTYKKKLLEGIEFFLQDWVLLSAGY